VAFRKGETSKGEREKVRCRMIYGVDGATLVFAEIAQVKIVKADNGLSTALLVKIDATSVP